MNQENDGLSKEAVEIGQEILEDGFVEREKLEALGVEVSGYVSPMEGVRAIAERAGLTEESRLELRRIVKGQIENKDLVVGQKVTDQGGREGMVVRLGPPVKVGSAMVQFVTTDAEEMAYVSDLKKL